MDGKGDIDRLCNLSAPAIIESITSHIASVSCILHTCRRQNTHNTSRAAKNEHYVVPPTTPNRCRRDDGDGDRADAQEGQRPKARSSSYQNFCPFSFSYSETTSCVGSGSAGALRRLRPRRRSDPVPPLGPAAADDRPGAPAAQCDQCVCRCCS